MNERNSLSDEFSLGYHPLRMTQLEGSLIPLNNTLIILEPNQPEAVRNNANLHRAGHLFLSVHDVDTPKLDVTS